MWMRIAHTLVSAALGWRVSLKTSPTVSVNTVLETLKGIDGGSPAL
jgi:hypothetical protein